MKKLIKILACYVIASLISSCGYARLVYIPKEVSIYIEKPILQSNGYSVGVAKNILVPPENAWLAGFNRGRRAYGVYDNPEVRALALSDGKKVFVFLTIDTIGLQRGEVIRIREAVNIPGVEVVIDEFSSHTHSAPDVIGIWGNGFGPGGKLPLTSGRDENYIDYIVEQSAKTIVWAVNSMELVFVTHGSSISSNLSKNRREAEILDREVSVIAFWGQRKVVGIVVNFGCHPETLHRENHLVTADFVAPLRDALDERWETTTFFTNGSLGGMVQPNFSWKRSGSFSDMRKMGQGLAQQAAEASYSSDRQLHYQPIVYKKSTIKISLENRLFWWAGFLGFMPSRGTIFGGEVETEVSVLRIDKITIVMVPGEIVPELGLEIKKLGGPGTQVWSLANDEIGYILKKEKFHTRTFQYERTMSLGSETGPIIMKAVEKLLKETAQR